MASPWWRGFLSRTQKRSSSLHLRKRRSPCAFVRINNNFQVLNNLNNNLSEVTPKIINISSYDCNQNEISLLSKSLKFCVTSTRKDLTDLRVDISEFLRKIQLLELFGHNTSDNISNFDKCVVKKTGTFIPLPSKDPFLQTNIKKMKEFAQKLHTLPVDRVHSNITAAERQAITSLSNNKNIIIRPVDKGGGIVIMDTAYYV